MESQSVATQGQATIDLMQEVRRLAEAMAGGRVDPHRIDRLKRRAEHPTQANGQPWPPQTQKNPPPG